MAILELPHDTEWPRTLTCSLCRVALSLDKATVGLVDSESRQAFACVSHLSDVEMLITGWADFMANERRKYQKHLLESDDFLYREAF